MIMSAIVSTAFEWMLWLTMSALVSCLSEKCACINGCGHLQIGVREKTGEGKPHPFIKSKFSGDLKHKHLLERPDQWGMTMPL